MSPFSHCLHRLRLDRDLRQVELAELVGYEQTYISALEVGSKGVPTPEFIERLIRVLELNLDEQAQLHEAIKASDPKLLLDKDSPMVAYWMMKELREKLHTLHPAQIEMIRYVIGLKEAVMSPAPNSISRIRRRRREGAQM